jgi:hypothetical protein
MAKCEIYTEFFVKFVKGTDQFGELGVNWSMVLNLRKQGVRVWIGFERIKIGSNGGPLQRRQ